MTDVTTNRGTAGAPSLEATLSILAEENPNLQAVLRLMEARAAHAEAEAEAAEADASAEELLIERAATEAAERARRREQSRAHLSALLGELHELQARNETLAAALGACPECWGRQLGCAGCGGRGAPGHLRVDPQLFQLWVAPTLRAVRRARADRGADRARPIRPTPAVQTGAIQDD